MGGPMGVWSSSESLSSRNQGGVAPEWTLPSPLASTCVWGGGGGGGGEGEGGCV